MPIAAIDIPAICC